MASMLALSWPRLLNVDEFLQIDFGSDLKAELDNGYIRMMAGGTKDHARVQANILTFLAARLRGSGCRAYGSDMGVRAHDMSLRYPDVSVECGSQTAGDATTLAAPCVLVEVLSPSTREHDLRVKKDEYRAIDSVDTIVFADPDTETVCVSQRVGDCWTDTPFARADVDLPSVSLTLPHPEIFARD